MNDDRQMPAGDPMTLSTHDRTFKVWEFQVSHGQLLLRSPKSPATGTTPAQDTNVDVLFMGVEFMCLPRVLRGLVLDRGGNEDDLDRLEATLGSRPDRALLTTLVSEGRRFPVLAVGVTLSENDWDIFESPIEFRSHFHAP